MNDVEINKDANGYGSFIIHHENQPAGEMTFQLSGNKITVDHTEVEPEFEGKGLAKKMFLGMIDYARENKLKVIANCSYVKAQMQKNKDQYADVS